MKLSILFFMGIAVFILQAPVLRSQNTALKPAHVVHAVRATERSVLDGVLNEETWKQAKPASQFSQRDPDEGKEARERTELRVAYDESAIYFGMRLFDREPEKIVRRLSRRDDSSDADLVTIQLSPYRDGLTGMLFQVSAAGVQRDAIISNDTFTDYSWDGVWESAVHLDEQGWSVEIRIPFSQLRFPSKEHHVWGLNASRFIHRRNETAWLRLVLKKDSGIASKMDDLDGIEGIEPHRHLDLMPYAVARSEFIKPVSGDPFNDGSRLFATAGLDMKYGVSSRFTLDATVNPDFGQVEVDPAVVNLSAFETYFPEKRPFFLEGAAIFNNFGRLGSNNFWGFNRQEPTLFYTRRIGRFPQGNAFGDFVESPSATTILGAGKLTGKTKDGLTIGLLEGVTSREFANVVDSGERSTVEVEPLTNYFVLRVLKEKQRGGIGLISTGLQRNLDQPALRDLLPGQAYVAGMDAYYYLDHRKDWVLTGKIAGSWLNGTPAAIDRLAHSPQHYFQRPDAPEVALRPGATSMKGWTGSLNLNRQTGSLTVNSAVWATSPGFESNDLGFQTGGDAAGSHVVVFWRKVNPDGWTRSRYLWGSKWWTWDFGRRLQGDGGMFEASATLKNYWSLWLDAGFSRRVQDNRLTRGGPAAVKPGGGFVEAGGQSDGRKKFSFLLNAGYSWDEYGGWNLSGATNVTFKPLSCLSISTGPSISRGLTAAQYVQTVADSTASNTYGSRYVFADLDQFQTSMTTRINWILSPKLSLQVFMQPLISVGDYWDYKELARPKTFSFLRYGIETGRITMDDNFDYTVEPNLDRSAPSFSFHDPDFNFKSLRVNAILRWEWKLGSTLYLVWTQDRQDLSNPGTFSASHDISKLFTAPANNILLVRLAYWLSR